MRKQNFALNRFERPAAVHQLQGQIVEQFLIAGRRSSSAEVIGSGDDAASKMPLPKTIHDDARGERIVFARDPIGQFQASATLFGFGQSGAAQHLRESAGS